MQLRVTNTDLDVPTATFQGVYHVNQKWTQTGCTLFDGLDGTGPGVKCWLCGDRFEIGLVKACGSPV